MNKTLLATLLAAACISPALAQAQWKPTKPVTIIVPWAAGGATDQVTRLAASELEAGLGQKIVVVNQPGGAGSIGTKAAMDAPKDGYTWTAGAAKQLGTYPVLGMINSKVDDFNLYLAVTNVSIVSVNPNSPYQTFPQLLEAMKASFRPVGDRALDPGLAPMDAAQRDARNVFHWDPSPSGRSTSALLEIVAGGTP